MKKLLKIIFGLLSVTFLVAFLYSSISTVMFLRSAEMVKARVLESEKFSTEHPSVPTWQYIGKKYSTVAYNVVSFHTLIEYRITGSDASRQTRILSDKLYEPGSEVAVYVAHDSDEVRFSSFWTLWGMSSVLLVAFGVSWFLFFELRP